MRSQNRTHRATLTGNYATKAGTLVCNGLLTSRCSSRYNHSGAGNLAPSSKSHMYYVLKTKHRIQFRQGIKSESAVLYLAESDIALLARKCSPKYRKSARGATSDQTSDWEFVTGSRPARNPFSASKSGTFSGRYQVLHSQTKPKTRLRRGNLAPRKIN